MMIMMMMMMIMIIIIIMLEATKGSSNYVTLFLCSCDRAS
jgi:hypothetical protein